MHLGGCTDLAIMPGGGRYVQSESLKAIRLFLAGVQLRAAGPLPVTALNSQSRKPNTKTIERPMLPLGEIETYEPFATQDAQFSIKTMPLNGALLRARLFLKLKSHGGSAFYPSAPNVAFPLTETKLRPVPIATSCGRLP